MTTAAERNVLSRTMLAITVGVFLGSVFGCDRRSPADASGPAESLKSGAAQPTAEESQSRRFNAAVAALNSFGRAGLSSWRQYARKFDPERGPTGKETSASVQSVDYASEGIAALKAVLAGSAAKDVLGQASARYVEASERLIAATAVAHRYYDQQDWRDDKFAKGKSMHPQLVAAYREFESAHTMLSAEVQRLGDSRRQARLAKMKASGQILRHDVELSLKQARDVLDFVEEQMAKVKHPHAMDLGGLKQRIDVFDATFAGLRDAAAKEPERVKKEFGLSAWLNLYVNNGDSFLLSAKEVLRAGRDRKPMPRMSNSSEQGLTGYYNQMVQYANNMNR